MKQDYCKRTHRQDCLGDNDIEHCDKNNCTSLVYPYKFKELDVKNDLNDTQAMISKVCGEIGQFLVEKNKKYGNSALNPTRIFSKASTKEQLNVRMDDKLSRIRTSEPDDMEDAKLDLVGYLILEMVQKKLDNN